MWSPASNLWTNGAGAEERLNLFCVTLKGTGRTTGEVIGLRSLVFQSWTLQCRSVWNGCSCWSRVCSLGKGDLLGTLRDSGHRTLALPSSGEWHILCSPWAHSGLTIASASSFQPGLGETQLRGSLVLGSRNFLVGLPTDRISCFLFFLKGKPWKWGDRGRLFPSWMSIPKPGALPGFRHGIYTRLLKITPWLNRRRGRGDGQATLLEGGRAGQGEGTCTQRPWEGFYSRRVMQAQGD